MSVMFKKGDRVRIIAHPDVTGIVEGVAKNFTGEHTLYVLVKWPWAAALGCDSVHPSAIELVPPPKPTLNEILQTGMVIKRYIARDRHILATVNSYAGKAAVLSDHRSGKYPVLAVYALGEELWSSRDEVTE